MCRIVARDVIGCRAHSPGAAVIADARAEFKRVIRTFRNADDGKAMALFALDLAFFLGAFAFTLLARNPVAQLAGGALMGLAIARLFVIGHDACHQCYVSDRTWNRRIAWLAFLPSLTTYSLWEAGHNLGHHVFTNLRGRDYVWTPLSKAEFDALPGWRRTLERFYRSGVGYGGYYLVELWWKKLMFPSVREMPSRRPVYVRDSAIVAAFACGWAATIVAVAIASGQSALVLLAVALVWPLLVWSAIMGAVIYLHHTHPQVRWYADDVRWEADRDGVSSTVHVTFPGRVGWLLNNIMAHPAHHLDVRIPLYNLTPAHGALAAQNAPVFEQPFSWAYVRDTIRRCKLYDYEAQRWMDFDGGYTSPPRSEAAAA
jgi:omega-6 fatty acid desaturase (delta-12 desaturase)